MITITAKIIDLGVTALPGCDVVMPVTNEERESALGLLRAKAIGLATTIEKMSADERRRSSSESFATNYNQMLIELDELVPEMHSKLPPRTDVFTGMTGDKFASIPTTELWMFCNQIVHLITAYQGRKANGHS